MIFLPAVQFRDHTIRLPVSDASLMRFCQLRTQSEDVRSDQWGFLANEPGLILWLAFFYCQQHALPIESLAILKQWLMEMQLPTELDKFSFSPVATLNEKQIKSLCRWNESVSKRTLERIVTAFSELDRECAKACIRLWLNEAVLDGLQTDGQTLNLNWRLGHQGGQPDLIRQMWLATARYTELANEYEARLFESKMKSLKQLAYGASHEINNPLANIASRAQALMADENRPSKVQQLAIIYSQAMRAHEMISDMMLFAHPPEIKIEHAHVVDLVKQLQAELRSDLKSKGIVLRIRQYPNVPACELDPEQLAIALTALIRNSINAIGGDGKIVIQIWRRNDHHVAISVVDNGPGIDAEIADQIFDPFFSGREAGRGLGFGLSKAWRIVEMHDGNVVLDSSHSTGTRIVMTLPIRQRVPEKKLSRIDNRRAA